MTVMTCIRHFAFGLVAASATVAAAGIPLPDVVLYGELRIGGAVIPASRSDVTVLGRVDGVTEPVGTYRMGDNPNAGDRYVLRIRLESLADGAAPSNNAAQIGQTVNLFAKEGDGAEQAVGTFAVSAAGVLKSLNLPVTAVKGDGDNDGDVDVRDFVSFVRCFSGPQGTPGFQPPDGPCAAKFDFEPDGDVDFVDFVGFVSAFTGPK